MSVLQKLSDTIVFYAKKSYQEQYGTLHNVCYCWMPGFLLPGLQTVPTLHFLTVNKGCVGVMDPEWIIYSTCRHCAGLRCFLVSWCDNIYLLWQNSVGCRLPEDYWRHFSTPSSTVSVTYERLGGGGLTSPPSRTFSITADVVGRPQFLNSGRGGPGVVVLYTL